MRLRLSLPVCTLFFFLFFAPRAVPSSRNWNRPVKPFRIADNLYYVGASDLTSFLITTPKGDILLDGGLRETAPQIERNVAALGFRMTDVKILLNSHAHMDHAGGLAELKRVSGAQLVASRGDTHSLETGDHDDFAWGNRLTFPRVHVDRIIGNGARVTLGTVTMTAHVTPGHTRGCTTWTVPVTDRGKTYNVVFVCSTTAPGYKLAGNKKYPEIAQDYEHTFKILRSLPCDIFLASHGSFFDLTGKRKRLESAKINPFIDPDGYRAFLDRTERDFRSSLAAQSRRAT
ncbi:MAG: subclass B3 metallo-beta-lactamase [Bryobacteraceae bacterium]